MVTSAMPYVLGHTKRELERLDRQARLIDGSTRQFFKEAGLEVGMRVLDVGSGAGHTAFIAAEIVGTTGQVIGTDRSPDAVSTAQANAAARSLANLTFRCGDPTEMCFDQPFDAVVGRYVLIFNDNQAGMLRSLANLVKDGGLVIFHEPSLSLARSVPEVALYDQCCKWALNGFIAGGTLPETIYHLHRSFTEAGLPPPVMRMHAPFGGAPDIFDWLHILVDMIRTLLPTLEKTGIASADEIDIDTLAERLCSAVATGGWHGARSR